MSKFYIPGVEPHNLHGSWEDICRKFGSWSGYRVTKRHVRCISYMDDGVKKEAEVGHPDDENQIIAICETLETFVCVRRSDLTTGDPLRVNRSDMVGIEYFD